MITYQKATLELLNQIWDMNISMHPDDKRWIRWKDLTIQENMNNQASTYIILDDGKPIGEGTLLFDEHCRAIKGRSQLATKHRVCNINALRILKPYEGKGYISQLFKFMEASAKQMGYQAITIGVEASEARNLAIYLHLGYTQLIHYEIEDGELVLYYKKNIEAI